jgi:hypothetical protein
VSLELELLAVSLELEDRFASEEPAVLFASLPLPEDLAVSPALLLELRLVSDEPAVLLASLPLAEEEDMLEPEVFELVLEVVAPPAAQEASTNVPE